MDDQLLLEEKSVVKKSLEEAQIMSGFGFFLNWFGRKFQRILHSPSQPPELSSVLIFYIIILGVSLLIDFIVDRNVARFFLLRFGSIYALNILTVTVLVFAFRIHSKDTFSSLGGFFVDSIIRIDDMVDFHKWINAVLDYRKQVIFSILGAIFFGIYPAIYFGQLMGFKSPGYVFYLFILTFLGSSALYGIFMFMILPLRIKNYDYKIYSADPSEASFTKKLAKLLSNTVYLFAVAALIVLSLAAFYQIATDVLVMSMLGILMWLPITLMFTLNQIGLSTIIARTKINKLAEIEVEIKKLETSTNLADKESLEAINRLMDYHERVQKNSNSALDLRAILSYLNSLLIPTLGFIIDTLIKLFTRNP